MYIQTQSTKYIQTLAQTLKLNPGESAYILCVQHSSTYRPIAVTSDSEELEKARADNLLLIPLECVREAKTLQIKARELDLKRLKLGSAGRPTGSAGSAGSKNPLGQSGQTSDSSPLAFLSLSEEETNLIESYKFVRAKYGWGFQKFKNDFSKLSPTADWDRLKILIEQLGNVSESESTNGLNHLDQLDF